MNEVVINYLAVLFGAIATLPIGFIWYELLFKKQFNAQAKLENVDKKLLDKAAPVGMLITLLSSLFAAYGLQYSAKIFSGYLGISFFEAVFTCAVMFWAIFFALRTVMHDTFELRPRLLTLIHVGYDLAALLVTALVLGLMV
jgi:hypothetical protein